MSYFNKKLNGILQINTKTIFIGLSLFHFSLNTGQTADLSDEDIPIATCCYPLSKEESMAIENYINGMEYYDKGTALIKNNRNQEALSFFKKAIPFLKTAAEKGHIPSQIKLLKIDIKRRKFNYDFTEKEEKNIIAELHQHNKLTPAYVLTNLEEKLQNLRGGIEHLGMSIHDLMCIQENIIQKDPNLNVDFMVNSPSLFRYEHCFFDDTNKEIEVETEAEGKATKPIQKKTQKQESQEIKKLIKKHILDINTHFDFKIDTNKKIIERMTLLSNKITTNDLKKSIDAIIKIMDKNAQITKERSKDHKDSLQYALTMRQKNIGEILNYYEVALHDDPYSLNPILLECFDYYINIDNILSYERRLDLYKILNTFFSILKLDGYENINSLKISIFKRFLSLHDDICVTENIPIDEKLDYLMSTLYFASNQLKTINYKNNHSDEDFFNEMHSFGNSVENIEGKYVSWSLNLKYSLYKNILFGGSRINHNLLDFYHFSISTQKILSYKNSSNMYDYLVTLKEFQHPIFQQNQTIFVHKTKPYVLRMKAINTPKYTQNRGYEYTIGLIQAPYIISDNLGFFNLIETQFEKYFQLKSNLKSFPTIFEPQNEILKFTYYNNTKGNITGPHGGIIPANINHRNGWDPEVGYIKRLMDNAHFNYN